MLHSESMGNFPIKIGMQIEHWALILLKWIKIGDRKNEVIKIIK